MEVLTGEIVGTVELRAGVEEDYSSLFGESPYDCPSRPPDELNMAIFQLHLARLLVIVESAKEMLDLYMYLISWKNPLVTLLSLIVFIRCTITLRPEHLTSFPVLLMIVRMVYLAFARSRGRLKNKWLRREVEKYRKVSATEGPVFVPCRDRLNSSFFSLVSRRKLRLATTFIDPQRLSALVPCGDGI